MRVSKVQRRHYDLPIYGAGADISGDSLLKIGASAGTDNGMLVTASGTSAIADSFGILENLHDYSEVGDTLMAGTKFVTAPVELIDCPPIITIEFDLTAANAIVCTQAVNSTTMTVTSLEDDIDGSFIYVVSGTGAGQTNYMTASASGSCTLKAAFTTDLDTTSYFIKILPRFHKLLGLSADGKLTSQAAAGAVAGAIIDLRIRRAGITEQMDPTKHAALTGLNSLKDVRFEADIVIHDGVLNPVD